MPPLTVCSFYVDRRADYPDAVDYIPLLLALNRSCHRLGFEHVVLSDRYTMEQSHVRSAPLQFAAPTDLPRALSRALTEAQARHMEAQSDCSLNTDLLFVGADCLIRRDFRDQLPAADLSIILRPGHKRHRINNGFMYVPAESVKGVAPLFRKIADGTGPTFNRCDDMVAVERALAPMPDDYCLTERGGLTVNFLSMDVWNGGPRSADDPADQSHVLHFRGRARKAVMLDWAARWMPEDAAC